MATKIKFEIAEKIIQAQNQTINDLVQENYMLKQQMNSLLTKKENGSKGNRTTFDLSV